MKTQTDKAETNPAAVIHGMGSEPLEKIRAEEQARIERNKANAKPRFYCARCGRQHHIFNWNGDENRKKVAVCGSIFHPNGQPV